MQTQHGSKLTAGFTSKSDLGRRGEPTRYPTTSATRSPKSGVSVRTNLSQVGMTRVLDRTSRKAPVQDRSRDTVRRILDAAAQVLKERGYDGASTNRIAAAAGISPGSLYQYFPNKDAILTVVVAEYAEQYMDYMSCKLNESLRSDPAAVLSEAVRAQVDALLERREILQMISGQLPGYSVAKVLKPVDALYTNIISGYAGALPDQTVGMDVGAATWILVRLLDTAIRYVVEEPPIAKDVFIKEMTRLVMSHPLMGWVFSRSEADHAHRECPEDTADPCQASEWLEWG